MDQPKSQNSRSTPLIKNERRSALFTEITLLQFGLAILNIRGVAKNERA